MQGTAFILIRSVVANPGDRQLFDHWYQTDHIPIIFSKIASVNQAWRRRTDEHSEEGGQSGNAPNSITRNGM
jgi:hypothetical protein